MAGSPAVNSATGGLSRKHEFLGLAIGLIIGVCVAFMGYFLLMPSYWWSGVGAITGILGWSIGRQLSATSRSGSIKHPPVLW